MHQLIKIIQFTSSAAVTSYYFFFLFVFFLREIKNGVISCRTWKLLCSKYCLAVWNGKGKSDCVISLDIAAELPRPLVILDCQCSPPPLPASSLVTRVDIKISYRANLTVISGFVLFFFCVFQLCPSCPCCFPFFVNDLISLTCSCQLSASIDYLMLFIWVLPLTPPAPTKVPVFLLCRFQITSFPSAYTDFPVATCFCMLAMSTLFCLFLLGCAFNKSSF